MSGTNGCWSKPCCCVNADGTVVRGFSSRTAAARWLDGPRSVSWRFQKIARCCDGTEQSAFGYSWRYLDGDFHMSPSEVESLVGRRFGSLTVVKGLGLASSDGSLLYACKCDCGAVRVYPMTSLVLDKVTSCGCLDSVKLLDDAVKAATKLPVEIRSKILGGAERETAKALERELEI